MKMYTCLIVALFVALTHAVNAKKMPVSPRISEKTAAAVRQITAEGCNANVCFAIDGSSSLSEDAFKAQLDFVLDVVSLIGIEDAFDEPNKFAAVQYSSRNSRISRLTDDIGAFNVAVEDTTQRGGGSFVAGGINYCFSQLFRLRNTEPIKIVLLGEGISNIGASAVRRAALFRRVGGNICTVAAGESDMEQLQAIAGDDGNVFQVDDFLNVLELEEIVLDLVANICSA